MYIVHTAYRYVVVRDEHGQYVDPKKKKRYNSPSPKIINFTWSVRQCNSIRVDFSFRKSENEFL